MLECTIFGTPRDAKSESQQISHGLSKAGKEPSLRVQLRSAQETQHRRDRSNAVRYEEANNDPQQR
jgi:hypothetical protein